MRKIKESIAPFYTSFWKYNIIADAILLNMAVWTALLFPLHAILTKDLENPAFYYIALALSSLNGIHLIFLFCSSIYFLFRKRFLWVCLLLIHMIVLALFAYALIGLVGLTLIGGMGSLAPL